MKLRFDRLEEFREEDGPKIVMWFDILDDDDVVVQPYRYSMPVDLFEYRTVEYGEMPMEELVEMVVAEAAMILGVGEMNDGLTTLATAPDQETARRDHLARCARVKLKWRISTRSGKASSGAASLMEELKRVMPLRPEAIAKKRKQYRQHREG